MRWLAVLFLVLNAGLFAWHSWLRDEPGEGEAAGLLTEAAPSLVRLEEVNLDDFAPRVPLSLGVDGACFAIGPLTGDYSQGAAMGRVREWLMGRGGVIHLRGAKFRELAYYWVYFPPAGTRDAAQDRMEELAASAFPNAAVIPEGSMKNAVSIRVYGLRTALERDLARLKARGFEPQVQRIRRVGRSLWFTAVFPAGYEFPGRRFSRAFPGLEAIDTACPSPREPEGIRAGQPSGAPPAPGWIRPAAPGSGNPR